MKIKKWELSILIALILTMILSTVSFADECVGIRQSVLRLHVLANSDSQYDQALKLKVRDRLLVVGNDLFSGAQNEAEAKEKAKSQIVRLTAAAEDEIKKNGAKYSVKIEIAPSYFDTRTYDNKVTLPAGKYDAVRVLIGDAKGKNWWCVMFPPMCLPAAEPDKKIDDVLNENQQEIALNKPKYEFRFKTVEIFEDIKKAIGW